MDKGLDRVGVNVKHQKEKMVSCNFEGVAVMLAKQSGVAKRKTEGQVGQLPCVYSPKMSTDQV